MWLYRTLLLARPLRRAWPIRARADAPLPASGGALLAANHASFIDPLFLGAVAPRPVRFLITESWYRRSPLWRFLFDGCGVIPTAAVTPERTIAAVVQTLAAGDLVGVFPEGLISADGRLQRFRHGIGWMAALSGAPVHPCGIRGNHDSLPRQRRWPRFVPVTVRIGAPLRFPGAPCRAPDPGEVQAFVERVARAVCRLAGQEERWEAVRPKRAPVDLRPALAAAFRESPR